MPIHGSILRVINESLMKWKFSLPNNQQNRVRTDLDMDQKATEGPWKSTTKVPDLAFQLRQVGGGWEEKLVIEAGFSQDYESLKETACLWLEGMKGNQVEMVILIHYEETPSYHCQLPAGKNPSTQNIPLNIDDIDASHTVCMTSTGPVRYKGKDWVGKIAKVSMEIWTRGPDGKARRRDPTKDLLTETELRIPVRDFLPAPYQGNIVVDLDLFRDWLPDDLRDQACIRIQTAVSEWHKRRGDDPRDIDYQPPGQRQGQGQSQGQGRGQG